MIEVYIGPNGFGKTTKLIEIQKNLENSGISRDEILFLESEILLSDEVKDSKDETKTMEYILTELLETPAIQGYKNQLQNEIDNTIIANQANVNSIINSIMTINGQTRTKNFITPNSKKIQYKQVVTIDKKEFIEKTGSGQRMQLLLSLVKNSSKNYIFLDEPEKYSHPSLLNVTAKIIMDLSTNGKSIYIATHSPKLLSMLDISLSNIFVINDASHSTKTIDLRNILTAITPLLPIANFGTKYAKYYDATQCEDVIKKIHYKDFLECLFTRKIYLCEGINDKLFLLKYLQDNNKFYEDYTIMSTFGKFPMPLFLSIFRQLDIDVTCVFDKDNEAETKHSITNNFIETKSNSYYKFSPNIEDELLYLGNKQDNIEFYDYISAISFPDTTYNI